MATAEWHTKTRLAETIARRARLSAQKAGKPVTRMRIEEVMNQMSHDLPNVQLPALRTVLAEVRRQSAGSTTL